MNDYPKTEPAAILARHSKTWTLCDECAEAFERDRQAVQFGMVVCYCSHNGVHQVWNTISITTQLCASVEEAEQINGPYLAMRDEFLRRAAEHQSAPNQDRPKPN